MKINQSDVRIFNRKRSYNALSFRISSNTVLKTKNSTVKLGDNSVAFVPAELDYERISEHDELIAIHFATTDYHTDNIEFFMPKNPEPLAALFSEVLNCWTKKEIGYKYKCAALMYSVLSECYIQNYSPNVNRSKIENSVNYIIEHFRDKNLSISMVAEQSFISEIYFRKLFTAQYGISPKKHIINLRIKYAIGLISSGYYSLDEISDMCGYNDYKYFTTEFKRITGISPSKYESNN